ncbi:MAG: SUMF1/EgtB/PvdO family nonheme iron enzyme [Sinobacteraceae bacterium]|nr:SUMF1/EgtB/PvdO family nonheme iron enzyme [Nevskiaceae bacterium]
MADVALGAPPSIRLREPAGERRIDPPLRIGGAAGDAEVRVPGAGSMQALRFDWCGDAWWVSAESRQDPVAMDAESGVAPLRLNGESVPASGQELRSGDVLAIGAARVIATRVGPDGLDLDVRHLVGNDTVAPLAAARSQTGSDSEETADAEIVAAALDFAATDGDAAAARQDSLQRRGSAAATRRLLVSALAICVVALALLFGIVGRLQRVAIEAEPVDAKVRSAALLSWYSAPTLFVLPGRHSVRAEAEGYAALERPLEVRAGQPASLALRLSKLPGIVAIDTGGVVATVSVDGAEAGQAPGELSIAAGARTLTLRAARHLDVIQKITVEGAGARQTLSVVFEPSWGQLAVSATTPEAVLRVEGTDASPQPLPATLDLPAGVHRVSIAAPGARDWASSVLVKAGEVTTLGPLTLGAPDARLVVRSNPAGAEVTVAGVFRGRTPLEVALPGGTDYDVLVTRAGYTAWQRRVGAAAGARSTLDAQLQPIMATLTVRGEPADAELLIDGAARGRTPATLELLATRHAIEVRRTGLQSFRTEVDLTPALARTVEYSLLPEGRPAGWKPPTETLTGKLGTVLRLVPAGGFQMGSERREQGRRPNETLRRVTLSRPFYIAVHEVTNAEFRRFRPNHASGAVDRRSIDLDGQAVSNVGWSDAVQYCNWLSEQEGLPPAYEQKGGSWVLRTPATSGYRLPTEAEWEYAARQAGASRPLRRYDWGDALPVPPGHANLAGTEAAAAVERILDGWSDDYPAVAPPGRFKPNALGLYDMTGNVSEWTHDVYASFVDPAPVTDPAGPSASGARHVIKGSSWRTASFSELRAAWREGVEGPSQSIGFRVARHVD